MRSGESWLFNGVRSQSREVASAGMDLTEPPRGRHPLVTWARGLSTVAQLCRVPSCVWRLLAGWTWLQRPRAPLPGVCMRRGGGQAGRRRQQSLGRIGRLWARGLVSGPVPSVAPEICPYLARRHS